MPKSSSFVPVWMAPVLQELSWGLMGVACGHVSGFLARSTTAGPGGLREARLRLSRGLDGSLHEPGCPRCVGPPIQHHDSYPRKLSPFRSRTVTSPGAGTGSDGAARASRCAPAFGERDRRDQARSAGEQHLRPGTGLHLLGPAQHRLGAGDRKATRSPSPRLLIRPTRALARSLTSCGGISRISCPSAASWRAQKLRRGADLHADQTARQPGEERHHLSAHATNEHAATPAKAARIATG